MANMTWKTQEEIDKEEQAELNKIILEIVLSLLESFLIFKKLL